VVKKLNKEKLISGIGFEGVAQRRKRMNILKKIPFGWYQLRQLLVWNTKYPSTDAGARPIVASA
jgi:hypothetical protein